MLTPVQLMLPKRRKNERTTEEQRYRSRKNIGKDDRIENVFSYFSITIANNHKIIREISEKKDLDIREIQFWKIEGYRQSVMFSRVKCS